MKVLRAYEVKIQPTNIDSYRLIKKSLQEKNAEFHTFRPKQKRSYNVVLKSIHSAIRLDEIKEERKSWS